MRTTRQKKQMHLVAALAFTVLAAVGCGGGDGETPTATGSDTTTPGSGTGTPGTGSTTPSALVGAEGLWRSGAGVGARYLLVEPDGQLWGIPTATLTGGSTLDAFKGTVSLSGTTVSGSYNDVITKQCALLYTCSVSGTKSATQLSLSGVKSLSGSTIPDWSYSGTPDATYSTSAQISQVAGTWNMTGALPSNFLAGGSLTIGGGGSVTVSNIGGCSFSGTLTPVTGKGYYRLSVSSVGGSCGTGITASQIRGVAFRIVSAGRPDVLSVMWHVTSFSQYFWSTGVK